MYVRTFLPLVVCAAFTGCAKGPEPGAEASASSSTPPAAGRSPGTASKPAAANDAVTRLLALPTPRRVDVDPCALLTAEDVAGVITPVQKTEYKDGREDYPYRECTHRGGSMDMEFVLVKVGGYTAEEFDAVNLANAEAVGRVLQVVPGLGDKAYWNGQALWVLSGTTVVQVNVAKVGKMEESTHLDITRPLAELAVSRL